jgi:hypothetical protein
MEDSSRTIFLLSSMSGQNFFVDGSYLYTPLPSVRNAFRSTRGHTTLALPGQEQNPWREGLRGLFTMRDQAKARVVRYGPKHFEGEHEGFETKHHRRFEWEGDSLSSKISSKQILRNLIQSGAELK